MPIALSAQRLGIGDWVLGINRPNRQSLIPNTLLEIALDAKIHPVTRAAPLMWVRILLSHSAMWNSAQIRYSKWIVLDRPGSAARSTELLGQTIRLIRCAGMPASLWRLRHHRW